MPAPRILWRYVLKDVAVYTLLGMAMFAVLLVVQNLLRFLEELLLAGVSASDLVALGLIILPTYLAYAIPTSLLFGILLSFGRMSADGEIIAMRASGISVRRLLPPVLALGACAAMVNAYVSFEVEPRSYLQMKQLVRELAGSADLIQPGMFRRAGKRMLYIHSLGDESCPLAGVLIADFSIEERTLYVTARCGLLEGDAEGRRLSMRLLDGSIDFGEAPGARYRRLRFAELRTELDVGAHLDRRRTRDLTFGELLGLRADLARGVSAAAFAEDDPARSVEVQLHRRAAFALSALVLGMLALPLGIRPLRAGRSWGALIAAGLMGLYWCLFSIGELTAERGWIPPWLGLWLPNGLVLLLALWLIRRSSYTDS